MIRGWKFDDGSPVWSPLLGQHLGDQRQPAWRFTMFKRDPDSAAMQEWLEENLIEGEQFDLTFRFNSGDPAVFAEIYDMDAAALFYLTWNEHISVD